MFRYSLCAEAMNGLNRFTSLQGTMEGNLFHAVSITEDDDLLSPYGRATVNNV